MTYTQQQIQDTIKRTLRAVIYCRVSTDKQEQDGESLEYQEEKCRKYARLHGIEVVMVLKEAKSGFIHYLLREQLTLARKLIRDGLANMLIVFDLRRFSRNFVHSAMIFKEIESVGAQIVSVEEYKESTNIIKLSTLYQQSILGFLGFLTTMRGKYHEATFKEKRNALDVLGVKVYLHPDVSDAPEIIPIETEQEWFTISEASQITEITKSTLVYHIGAGNLITHKKTSTVVHRDELIRFLNIRRPGMSLDAYPEEWFTISKISTITTISYNALHRAIRIGELRTQEEAVFHPIIHRDELNRFLRETPVRPRKERENIEPRVEITYSPMFTDVQSSLR